MRRYNALIGSGLIADQGREEIQIVTLEPPPVTPEMQKLFLPSRAGIVGGPHPLADAHRSSVHVCLSRLHAT